jgi:hypothetical protein
MCIGPWRVHNHTSNASMHVAVKSPITTSIADLSVRPLLTPCGGFSRLGGTKPLEEGVLLRYQARDYAYLCFPFHYS